MLIRGPYLKYAQRGRTSAFFQIPQYLVASSVFFDDIQDMFKNRRFADPFGTECRSDIGPAVADLSSANRYSKLNFFYIGNYGSLISPHWVRG
ncbi:MAG: hypothetical protein IPG82_19690 [Saprospiraceae bacterium]|nr:hypothetical protein [Saprospiraceae bacterium]